MNRYRSHKEVEAGPISSVQRQGDHVQVLLLDGEVITTEPAFIRRLPDGWAEASDKGWFVRYDDGYESWSPTDAFCKGYDILIEMSDQTDDQPDGWGAS